MTVHDFPWLAASLIWATTLALGIYLGRLSERHKEYVMSVRESVRAWFDHWYRVLYSITAVLAVVGVLMAASATRQNSRDLVTGCENANESRQAARALWGYVIDVSAVSNPSPSADQQRVIESFRAYVNEVYAPRDCTDLSRKYVLPDPPKIVEPERDR